ncbi:hypothetical protein YPPY58_3726, partial [Yersinia pestis PY-58]
MNSFIPFFNT